MLDILLILNLPFYVILIIPIIISEAFFKHDTKKERLKSGLLGLFWITLGVAIVNILWLLIELITAGSMVQYLLSFSYTGRFTPSLEHIFLRTLVMTLNAIPWYLVFIFAIIIARDFFTAPQEPLERSSDRNILTRWFNNNFQDFTQIYNRGIPLIAGTAIDLWLFQSIIASSGSLNISYVHRLSALLLGLFNDIFFTLFLILTVLVPLKVIKYRFSSVEDSKRYAGEFEETKSRVYFWIFGSFIGGFAFLLIIHDLLNSIHNFGESIYSGKAVEFTIIIMLILILIELCIIAFTLFFPLDKFGLMSFQIKTPSDQDRMKFYSLLLISMVTLTSFTVLQPIFSTTPTFFTHQTAFSDIKIADNPIDDFPVNLSNLRLVSSDLARDISKASPSSPPKPYALTIMDDKDMVGMIDGRPAWIIPMKYESQFNPDANVIAGYVRVFLDDPIPEHIEINFKEMKYGWGLNGYNDISYLALNIMPDAFIGNDGISFIDPYRRYPSDVGEPVWLLKMSKYNEWGLEVPAGVLIIKGDGSYEKLTVEEATKFDPEAISDSVFIATADRAGNYIRSNQQTGEFEFDFSSKGLFTVPTSPDRFIDIGFETGFEEDDYYLRPHHYLLKEGNWFGRIYYRKTTTSNVENVIAITVENTTMTMFDLRHYERGGLKGVHTPDDVMDDLENEFERSLTLKPGESLANYRVRQPTLYKATVDNGSVLIWVSLIIYVNNGADKLKGAVFVDAANPNIIGYTTRSDAEPSVVFKQRLTSNIKQTYQIIGTDNTTGQTLTKYIRNGTIIYHDWIGQDNNDWKIYIMRVWDNDNDTEWRILVRKNEANTGAIYTMAASAMVGEHYSFWIREDKDEQVYILYDMSEI